MELLFSKRFKEFRIKRGLTQEQIASAIGISPQSVSKWERDDGYPDITLLPVISSYFDVTVDELIGSDESTRERDVVSFFEQYRSIPVDGNGHHERMRLAKQYYAKFPHNFDIINQLEEAIVQDFDHLNENYDLMKELHDKIMSGCTDEEYRRNSMHRMCFAADDLSLENCISKSELNWQEAVSIGELCEERFLLQRRFDEYRDERNATDLLVFMQYIGRNNFSYYEQDNDYLFDEPERTAAWEKHKIRLLESFSEDENDSETVPEAWCGCYAEFTLKAAAAEIGSGNLDEGFVLLEKAFPLYERWNAIPAGKNMRVGCKAAFGNVTITKIAKGGSTDICFQNGKKVWTPYCRTWQKGSEPCCSP